ncbi:MAG: hypothetical protein ACOYL3_21060 [Desulfuromonadaceae bacterium]
MADKYNSKFARFVGWLNNYEAHEGFAVTIGKSCTLYSVSEDKVHADWRRHELVHQRQLKELGWWRFMYRYFFYNITRGYRMNPFEQMARGETDGYNDK